MASTAKEKPAIGVNLKLTEAAARLGVSPHALRQWSVYQRRVPYLKLGTRIVFKLSDLEAFEQQCRVPAR